MLITLIVLALAAFFFIWGKIRSDVVALCALLALMLTNILTPSEALSGFSSSIVIMMAALFVVGGGIFQTGLAKMISLRILKLAGNSELKLFILIMLVTALIGSFVSNTGTVALMLPIIISLAAVAKKDSRRFLMPLAFASSMGGMMTLIGTPPNLIISEVLDSAGYGALSFFSFLPVGMITLVVGMIALWPMSKILQKKEEPNSKEEKRLNELAQEYQLAQNLYRLKVGKDSLLLNKKLQDLSLTERFNISIIEIRRNMQKKYFFRTVNVNSDMPGASSIIHENDILYVLGEFEDVKHFLKENKLFLLDTAYIESKFEEMDFRDIGIAELVLMSDSNLIDKKVSESEFRSLYNVNVLGIQRRQKYILQNIKEEKMQAGDALLIQGKWKDIANLEKKEGEWVLIGKPLEEAEKFPLSGKAPIAAIILIAMVLAMVSNALAPVTATVAAAVLMVLTGCLRSVEAAYKTINWESIVLFAGMIPISIAMEKTGTSAMIAQGIVDGLGGYGSYVVLAGFYLATSITTMFLSNTATAILFAPIALQSAISLEVSPVPFVFAVAVAASMCFASPFSTPPNALVMSAGRYTFMDYIRVGLPLQLLYAVIMVFVLPLIFPF